MSTKKYSMSFISLNGNLHIFLMVTSSLAQFKKLLLDEKKSWMKGSHKSQKNQAKI